MARRPVKIDHREARLAEIARQVETGELVIRQANAAERAAWAAERERRRQQQPPRRARSDGAGGDG